MTSCWSKLPDGRVRECPRLTNWRPSLRRPVSAAQSRPISRQVGPQVDCPATVMKSRDTQSQSGKCATLHVTALGQCLAADAAKGRGK